MGLELHNHSKRNQATKPVTQSCLQCPSVTKNTEGKRQSKLKTERVTERITSIAGFTTFDS